MAIGKGVWVKLSYFGPSDGSFFMHVFFYVFGCAEFKKSKIKKSYGEKVLKIAKN